MMALTETASGNPFWLRFAAWLRGLFRVAPTAQPARPVEPDELGFEDLTLPPLTLHLVKRHDQLLAPEIYDLTLRMLQSHPLAEPKAALLQIMQSLAQPQVALLAVQEGDEWPAMALLEAQRGLFTGVLVLHFYSSGSARAREHLVDAMKVFARHHGAERILGIDMNHKTAAFTRLFKSLGPSTVRGELVEFVIQESDA